MSVRLLSAEEDKRGSEATTTRAERLGESNKTNREKPAQVFAVWRDMIGFCAWRSYPHLELGAHIMVWCGACYGTLSV